jgi:hypothetical protein
MFAQCYKMALKGKSDQKFAFLVNTIIHSHYNTTFQNTLTTMENERTSKLSAFGLGWNNMLLNRLNALIRRLNEAGISDYLDDYGQWFISRIFIEEVVDPRRILSLDDLGFGFVIWLVACFVSVLVFVIEILNVKLKMMFKSLIRLLQFLIVLRARLNYYHDGW